MRVVLLALFLVAAAACSDNSDPPATEPGPDAADVGRDTAQPDTGGDVAETDAADAPDLAPPDTSDAGDDDVADADVSDIADADVDDVADVDVDDVGDDIADADAGDSDTADVADVPDIPEPDCTDDQIPAAQWPDAEFGVWEGQIELGQTHVVVPDDPRLAAVPVEGRSTLVLFTPETPIPDDAVVLLSAWDGDALHGVLRMRSPLELPSSLESDLTDAPVPVYSDTAWSAVLPHEFVVEGHILRIAHLQDGAPAVFEHTLEDLGAPHRITITRTKMVLFGEADFETATTPTTKTAQDFFATVPAAELRFVDGNDWRLDEFVVRTVDGPRLVHSEAERREVASDEDHWSILKHQFALRMSLANTGRGLALTGESQGDSSPYSFGTSIGQGWFRTPEGSYRDIDDAPWAAGWTGWTAMWVNECGNGFIHEVGHSFTMAHFTGGSAENWGIADEYPLDGTNVEGHPWGWDTTRNQFRTWFRVDGDGPVVNEGQLVGKRDPMNGGESPNAITCFPQYTGYHAQKAQNWMVNSPTLRNVDGEPGIYLWNRDTRAYDRQAAAPEFQEPVGVDVPVATLVGTLGNVEEANQVYPPIYLPSGNAFALPDPFEPGLHESFEGARWFVEIAYADDASDFALINRGAVEDTSLYLFSFNVALDRQPTHVRLFWAAEGYPDIALEDAQMVHERELVAPEPFRPIVTVGAGKVANAGLRVAALCEEGINCDGRSVESTWRVAGGALRFTIGDDPEPATCTELGAYTEFTVPVRSGETTADLTLRAQRVVASGGESRAVALHDATDWIDSPDLTQSLRIWAPWEANRGVTAGRYRLAEPVHIRGTRDGELFSVTPLTIDLEVLEATPVDLGETFISQPLTSADSSMYFLLRDPAVGPTSRVWWGSAGPTPLRVTVVEEGTQEPHVLRVHAQQEACGQRWDLHAGRGAGNCEHQVVLWVAEEGNEGLTPGRTYVTPGSAPLVIEGRRWHDPDGQRLEGVFSLALSYTP